MASSACGCCPSRNTLSSRWFLLSWALWLCSWTLPSRGLCFPLSESAFDDLKLIAGYAASLRQLAHWVYLVVAPAAALVYPILVHKQHWSWHVVAFMVAILLVASWCGRVTGTYGAVLIVRRDRAYWYRAQMISSLGSLALLGVVWAMHALNAFSALLVSLAGIVYISLAYYLRAKHLLGTVGRPMREMRKSVVHLALPNIPMGIFYALQGQVSLLLITWFGHTTAVASVGALGRLGQVFFLFGQMTPLLIEPYFAKLREDRLARNYLGALAAIGAFCVVMTGLAAYLPQVFLWILGHKYSGLRREVLLMIAASSVSYLGGVLWFIHCARRFVYWWTSAMIIFLTLAVDVLFIVKVDLSTVRAVLTLGLTTAAVGLLITLLTGIYGFVFGPRKTPIVVAVPAAGDLA